jgi:predicted transcriptional regulator
LGHLDYKIGESELKQILKYAKEEGFILQGRGRKGSVLTKKGELFLSN